MSPNGIDKFFKRHAFDHIAYGHLRALISNLPTITIEKAILNFLAEYKIDEKDLSVDSIKKVFARIQKEYFDSIKTKADEKG